MDIYNTILSAIATAYTFAPVDVQRTVRAHLVAHLNAGIAVHGIDPEDVAELVSDIEGGDAWVIREYLMESTGFDRKRNVLTSGADLIEHVNEILEAAACR